MSEHAGDGAHPTPPPPVVADAAELVVEATPPVHHHAGRGFDLVKTVSPGGDIAWTLFMARPDTEKPEPVSDRTEQDH